MNKLLGLSMLLAPCDALVLSQVPAVPAARAGAPQMAGKGIYTKAKYAPKGAFGGSGGPDDGWVGDQGQSVQVQKFEEGSDYLFFQGPAPKTAIQDDLPSFFSAENFAGLEISPLQIVVTVTGVASFAAVASVL